MLKIAVRRIKVEIEVPTMTMTTPKKTKEKDAQSDARLDQLLALLEQEVREQVGSDATFEERNDAAFGVLKKVLWRREDADLRGAVTTAREVEVAGKRYVRLNQPSSATYYGRWGSHDVEEPLYREVGVHNGPTIKPIEHRMGMIARHMTPDLARVMGELSADGSSREVERTMRAVGQEPPGRAFIERRTKQMGGEIADQCEVLEQAARVATAVPKEVASVSCGLDRFSVRMSEPVAEGEQPPSSGRRMEPYERTPPPPRTYHYRKAWVGSATLYDAEGTALETRHYSVEANADPNALADRVAADVNQVLQVHPTIPVHCIQDAAPELRALPEALARALPSEVVVRNLIDFEHLVKDYLDVVVDRCEPEGDPNHRKDGYRNELLHDDSAIDRIWQGLEETAQRLDEGDTAAQSAVSAALSYIEKRKDKMRYASLYEANLPIGSGATEGTCWQMQRRVERPGQSWETPGLRGILSIRSLVLSDRWSAAWKPYAASHRATVTCMN
jgi:hypothetical protein